FAECLYELKLYDQLGAQASVILEKSRKYFYNEDSYLANLEYQRALELYFNSFVTAESRAARRAELINALDAYITHVPRYGQADFGHEKIISRLASVLCAWDEAAKPADNPQGRAFGACETYMTLFKLNRGNGDVKTAARSAVEGHKTNYYILKLLASMADDIGDTAVIRKALFALADIDGKNAAAYREAYMRYYCSDVLNSKTE
ncbi:MAG TPA: hypothetical protein PK467_19545, partial [Candidatus Wallbacteria bacterium]|nr:hypothetical protein [Candidatus Wallbacteria bacterium]